MDGLDWFYDSLGLLKYNVRWNLAHSKDERIKGNICESARLLNMACSVYRNAVVTRRTITRLMMVESQNDRNTTP